MHIDNAILSEQAISRADGKFDLIGVHGRIVVPSFPATVGFALYLDFVITPADFTIPEHKLVVRLSNPAGEKTADVFANIILPDPKKAGPGGPATRYVQTLPITVTFAGPGRWTFDVLHNNVSWRTMSIFVTT